jgi:hypothetical protein
VRWPACIFALGLLASPAVGQSAPAAAFKVVQRTERVTYYASKGRRVDVRRTEAFLDHLAALFGLPNDGWRIEYVLHDARSILHTPTGYAAAGMTDLDSSRIDSVREYHPHELTHAVAGRLGRPPLLFAEGLAVALTSEGQWHGSDLDSRAQRTLDANPGLEPFLTGFVDRDPDAAYAVAGSFVAYLLDHYGIDPLVAFFRGCGPGGDRYEYAFRRAYGRTVARASVEWQQALRVEPRSSRTWYDAATWPGSLRRERAALSDPAQLALAVPAERVADGRPRGLPQPVESVHQVLDLEPGESDTHPSIPAARGE